MRLESSSPFHQYYDWAVDWTAEEPGFDSQQGSETFLLDLRVAVLCALRRLPPHV
jgi:hypothetical protein